MSDRRGEPEVIVVGAGLSGLLAAGALQSAGRSVLVLDKSRGVGGRMATRRVDGHTADHGAQFFTAHQPRFRELVEGWVRDGAARQWSTGFTGPDGTFRDNGVPRYCGVGGMTAIAKHLARNLDLSLRSKVVCVGTEDGRWTVTTEDGETRSAKALLLTAPMPQSLGLLDAGEVPLEPELREELGRMDYASCFTLLARLPGPSAVPEPGGIWMSGEPLLWITDNRAKGVTSAPGTMVTVHAGPEFTREHWNLPDDEVIATMLAAARPWLGGQADLTQLHRWRYSVPLRVHPESCLALAGPAPLAFAGDAFGGPRVEAAALSGLAAGAALDALLDGRTP